MTWKLKQGVKWSDGKPFTAADVVFTLRGDKKG
ncbi:ABC transporter substrate-binding protein [Nostoc sp. UHCC 0302]